MTVHRHKWYCV